MVIFLRDDLETTHTLYRPKSKNIDFWAVVRALVAEDQIHKYKLAAWGKQWLLLETYAPVIMN